MCGRKAGWQAKAQYGSYLIDPEGEGAIPVRVTASGLVLGSCLALRIYGWK
jgi:hypothetical protein